MHKYFILALFPFVLVLPGCAHFSGSTEGDSGASPSPSEWASVPWREDIELETHILAGELAILRGQSVRSAREYVAALEYSSDPALARRAARIALYANKRKLAYRAASAWAQRQPESLVAQRTATRLALTNGTTAALREHAQRLVRLNAEGPGAGLLGLAQLLSGAPKQASRALSVMHTLVAAHSELAQAHYAYALLATRYQSLQTATTQVERALALHPDWRAAVLLQAEILIAENRVEAARSLIADFGGSVAQREQNQIALARTLLDYQYQAAAVAAFERALKLNPDNGDARYGLALLAMTLHQPKRASRALTRLFEAGYRTNEVAFYLGDIAQRQRNYAAAKRWYRQVNGGKHQFDAHVRVQIMRARLGDVAGALAALRSLESTTPGAYKRLTLAEAGLLLQANRLEAALALYNHALQLLPEDPNLLYGRSLVYARLGAIDQAEDDLRAVLAVQPKSPSALNALGYLLGSHSTRYQEALGYVRSALKARPGDPAIMDSLGWILYRMGHLDKARRLLTKAYRKLPDPEVAAHLGEVLWMLGEREQAREIWQSVLTDQPDAPIVRDTMKRLLP